MWSKSQKLELKFRKQRENPVPLILLMHTRFKKAVLLSLGDITQM